MGNSLFEKLSEIYTVKREALDRLVEDLVLRQEAESRHMTVEALLDAEVKAKSKPVIDEEVRAVYDSAADRFAGRPRDEAQAQLAMGMNQQRWRQRRIEFVSALKSRAGCWGQRHC